MDTKKLRLLYSVALSVALIAASICLMVACYQVYQSGGPQIYTAEKIAEAFAPISISVYIALILTFGGFVIYMLPPYEKEKLKAEKDYGMMLEKQRAKTDLSGCDNGALVAAIEKQTKLRKLLCLVNGALLIACTGLFLVYALQGENFHSSQITEAMISAMYVFVPCLLAPFGFSVFTAYACRASIRKELELLKQVDTMKDPDQVFGKKCKGFTVALRVVLVVAAVALICVGLMGDGWADVLTKAVNICRECVGLG